MSLTLSAAQCARAASAYRALLRAQRVTFKGDEFALKAAHQQTRILFSRFIPSSSASVSPFKPDPRLGVAPPELAPGEEALTAEKVDEHIEGAFEIAKFLRTNVVQGVKNEQGNYALRIHSETERGDNDSIKLAAQKQKEDLEKSMSGGAPRRRRRRNAPAPGEGEAQVGCCGGGVGP
ncbi:hypothetical protein JCM10213_002516 [Rhodosporidiobolus nylandii]